MATLSQPVVPDSFSSELAGVEVTISAAEAKTHLLRLLDEVARERKAIKITKRGCIVARLVPPQEPQQTSAFDQMFGRSKGRMKITGDIVSPDWESWGPEWR